MNQYVASHATTNLPCQKPALSSHKARKTRQSHGFTPMIRGRYKADMRQIDQRSTLARAVKEWRASLAEDLGGESAISTQQRLILDLVATDKMLIDSIQGWLMEQPSLVNRRKKSAYPILLQLASLKDGMARRLQMLGLERRSKPIKSLQDLLQGGNVAET